MTHLGSGLVHHFVGIFILVSIAHGFSPPPPMQVGPRCSAPIIPHGQRNTLHMTSSSSSATSSSSSNKKSNWDETGKKCKFGKKAYWDSVYEGDGANGADIPSETYSWYCGYEELKPFWNMLVEPLLMENEEGDVQQSHHSQQDIQVLVAGIGNDRAPVDLYDDGWTNMIAFDYSQAGVDRAKELFGESRSKAVLLQADARELPLEDGTVDVVFDKGTLDAIYITGEQEFQDSVTELTRVTDTNGVFVCVSAVIPPETLLSAFQNKESSLWETTLDGGLAFAPDGEATIDLGAQLYAFRRKDATAT